MLQKKNIIKRAVFILMAAGLTLFLFGCGTNGSGAPAANVSEKSGSEPNYASNDLAYLTQLGLMRGHLWVGHQLYNAGHFEHAKMHMKHPESELYVGIAPALSARGSDGFAAELAALSDAVSTQQPAKRVTELYQALLDAIRSAESAVGIQSGEPAERLRLVASLLEVAAQEYAIAVVDGQMQNAHEYQDALGFTAIAKEYIENLNSDNPAVVYAKNTAQQQLAALDSHWPALIPPQRLATKAASITEAAAAIQQLAAGVE